MGGGGGGESEAANEVLPCAGLNGNTQSDHNSGCNSSHTVCLSVDSKGCIKACRGRGLRGDNPNFFMIHKPLLCNLDNRSLARDDSLNFRVNCSLCSFSLSFQVVHLQGGATPKLKGNTLCRKLGKLLFFFGEADFLRQVGDRGENEAESAIFLSWFSVFDSADGALLWDKMDVSTWLSLCIFKVFVGIAGLLPVFAIAI